MRVLFLIFALFLYSNLTYAQCNTSNATSCACEDQNSVNCDLLPDIIVGEPPLLVNGNQGIIEYSQSGNGANDGRLRVSVSTPNIGHGPLTVRTTTTYICGVDTFYNTSPGTCPNGGQPKQLLNQRVYQKDSTVMSYYDRPAGSMTYHPSHGHMHVDDWGVYTLREEVPNDPDPLNWPIIGTGAKLAFCLMDYGSCSYYSGHCVDSAGNTLLNNDFPNYGLGGGSYSCSATEQGISSGWTDIYYQHLDGMWINIPPGTCNGDYVIVVQLDPYDYFLEENENNNLLVVPFTLAQQIPLGGSANITNVGPLTICPGDPVTLTANNGLSYMWSNGETTQSIVTTQPGTFSVTVTSQCGVATSTPITVSQVAIQSPSVQGDTICNSGQATLSAAAASNIIRWYDMPAGGVLLGSGSSFLTPVINTTTTYYVETEETQVGSTHYSTPHSNQIGNGNNHTNASRFLTFDTYFDFELVSVKVYASGDGNRTIEHRDVNNNVIQSATMFVPDGESRIMLNFPITPGTGYKLGVGNSPDLFRNNSGVVYPYNVSGILDITGSSAGSDYYYFFYDWEVKESDYTCVSARNAAVAYVDNCVGISETNKTIGIEIFPNPVHDLLNIKLTNLSSVNDIDLHLFDLSGREVMSKEFSGLNSTHAEFTVDLQNISAGFYTIELTQGDQSITSKITVE